MKAKTIVVWVNYETHEVFVQDSSDGAWPRRTGGFCDPIGAAYTQWREMNNTQRVGLMEETAIDLAMQGFDLGNVLRAFAEVDEFRALGSKSFPMCRALTSALVGRCLEPNTMSFEELLEHYRSRETT